MCASLAQSDPSTGIPPFATETGGQYDSVNLGNGNITLEIPVVGKSGKIPFSYKLVANYHAASWFQQEQKVWYWYSEPGLSGTAFAADLAVAANAPNKSTTCNGVNEIEYYNFVILDGTGASHPMPPNFAIDTNGCHPPATSVAADGSGYTLQTLSANPLSTVVYDKSGNKASIDQAQQILTAIDPDGVAVKWNYPSQNYTDTLGAIVLSYSNSNTAPYNDTYTFHGGDGTVHNVVVTKSEFTLQTNYQCGIIEINNSGAYLPVSISTPEGNFGITYETTPNYTGNGPYGPYITGRIASLTYPSGGSVSYTYGGTNNGTSCGHGGATVVPILTRTLNDNKGHTATWTYTNNFTPNPKTTTVADPFGNNTVYTFVGSPVQYQVEKQVYQGAINPANLLGTDITCYNGKFQNCSSGNIPAVTLPILQTDTYHYPGTSSSASLTETIYDSYGNITDTKIYGFGASYPPGGTPLSEVVTVYDGLGASCGTLSAHVNDRPCSITTYSSGNKAQQTLYTYNTGGHPIETDRWLNSVNGTDRYLKFYAAYQTNGALAYTTDVNGQITHFDQGSPAYVCNNLLSTKTTLPISGLTTSQTWDANCNGGVITQSKDVNQQPTTYTYNDPFWRITSVTDPLLNATTIKYPNATTAESSLLFNSSTVDTLSTTDGLGRLLSTQKMTAPNSGYDNLVQYGYGWNSTGAFMTKTLPGASASTTIQLDGMGRTQNISDGGGGVTTFTHSQNDVLVAGASSSRQMEYDGLGRITSVCELTPNASPANPACNQKTGTGTGFLTTYQYDSPVTNAVKVTQNANGTTAQVRTYYYDGIGRLTQEQNPETGNTYYYYDSVNSGGCVISQPGNLLLKVDAAGNGTCYVYDSLHRLLSAGQAYSGSPNITGTPDRCFVYDSATVNGNSMANAKGRMAEAYTVAQGAGCGAAKITDEGFSYSPRGELTDVYESTPNSGGYYHANAAYWADGALSSLAMSGIPNISYGTDGEGRTSTVSASAGQNPVAATSYNSASQVTGVTFGSTDSDTLTFDPNTRRMTQYKYTVNGRSEIGNVGWNANGTLGSLGITDPFNSTTDTQNCTYGYDDLARVSSVKCGSIWAQAFTYDQFGNVQKTGNSTWQPNYNNNNQYSSISGLTPHYDLDGNLTADTFHNYTWNAYGNVTAIDTTALTYDGLGRMVEQNQSGTYYQVVYSPLGNKLAMVKGQTVQQAFVPLPGGTTAEYLSWGLSHYRHPDWLGSERLESSTTRTIIQDTAYAPFGEPYSELSGGNGEISFTGENKDTDWLNYDFMYREYDPRQSRWISPDPAGLAAVNFGNPQTFNRYAYVGNNPLTSIDPLGLQYRCNGPCDDWPSRSHEPAGFQQPDCLVDGVEDCGSLSSLLHGDEFLALASIFKMSYLPGGQITEAAAPPTNMDVSDPNFGYEDIGGYVVSPEISLDSISLTGFLTTIYSKLNSPAIMDTVSPPVVSIRSVEPTPLTKEQKASLCYLAVQLRNNGIGYSPAMGSDPNNSVSTGTTVFQNETRIMNPSGVQPGITAQNGGAGGAQIISKRSDTQTCMGFPD